MDLMTRPEFEELVGDGGGTRVSLYVPTHRVSGPRESDADRLRWKKLLTAVEATLTEEGHARRDIDELLAPAWDLHGDSVAWSHMADGLAMFLAPGWQATYRVPLDLPEHATVGPEFVLTPLLPLLTDRNFVVLALSQKNVRVLRGARDRIVELELDGVPRAFSDVYEKDGPQSDKVPRPNASGAIGNGGSVYYGASALDNVHQQDMVEFLREVARGVESSFNGRTVPMILAGLPEWVTMYRDVSSYPHLVEAAIERNPDDLSQDDLRLAAWELVEERLGRENARLLDRFHEQHARGGAALGLDDAFRAAHEGRVDTLLMTTETGHPGGSGGPTVAPSRPEPYDIYGRVGVAARATLRAGGAVRVLEDLPDGAPVAAILRY
ncbi:hypothetical protein [Georgenia sp. Z1491]|uniref:baeRF3 domain-containing protein n=1 Tax=Georgenia sp. Z1491 TaxID=3416707 RepID=UPI003CF056CF